MSKITINVGSAPNAGDGDDLRTAFQSTNSNFTELYLGLDAKVDKGLVGASGLTMATASILGRSSAGTGAVQVLDVSTTKTILALDQVNNTSDLAKPISTDTQTALNGKEPVIVAGTSSQYWRGDKTWQTLDKTAVGLGNVDNTADADKPISTLTQTALNGKANTSHTHTVANITVSSTQRILGRDTTGAGAAEELTGATVKGMIGLGNVDNTSDADKPLSSAATTALAGKADSVHTHAISSITNLQSTLDGKSNTGHTHTISNVTGLQSALDAKAATSSLAAVATSGDYNDLTNKPTIPTKTSDLTNDSGFVVSGDLASFVEASDLAAVATSGSYNDLTDTPALFSGDYEDLNNRPTLAAVATSGAYNDLIGLPTIPSLAVDQIIWVSANGDDNFGTGNVDAPFATIQKAHDHADTNITAGLGVTIMIAPGTYSDDITLTRPCLTLKGFGAFQNGTTITGNLVIDPSVVQGSLEESAFALDDIRLLPSNGDGLVLQGSNECTLNLNTVKMNVGNGRAIYVNNSSATRSRGKWVNLVLDNTVANYPTIEVNNATFDLLGANMKSGDAETVKLTNTSMSLTNVTLEASSARIVDLGIGARLTTLGVHMRNNVEDANGVDMTNGAQFIAYQVIMFLNSSLANTGFAVKGTATEVLLAGQMIFQPMNPARPAPNKVSTALTMLALNNTPTPA